MGLALAAALAMAASACEPPRAPSHEPSRTVGLDVELPVWQLGRWSVSAFSDTLRRELASHNVQVTPQPLPGQTNVLVNLGLYENRHAIDVGLVRGGHTVYTGRVLVADNAMTTLDVAAELVATIVVQGLSSAVDPMP